MSDKLITLLHDARKNGGVSIGQLCAGICSESMYEKIERGQKSIDRESLKRLLARLGIDSGEYEHYLEYPDYDKWCHKMKIINHIEDGISNKIAMIGEESQVKLQDTMQKIVNDTNGGLICIII